MTVFRSKVDAWLVALVFVSLALATAGAVAAAATVGDRSTWLGLAFFVVVGAFVAWLFLATRYELDGRALTARSGPLRWRIDVGTIASVTPSRNPLSSPALSLDRLEVRHGKGKRILLSPADRDGFLRALLRADPALERQGDGLRRRA